MSQANPENQSPRKRPPAACLPAAITRPTRASSMTTRRHISSSSGASTSPRTGKQHTSNARSSAPCQDSFDHFGPRACPVFWNDNEHNPPCTQHSSPHSHDAIMVPLHRIPCFLRAKEIGGSSRQVQQREGMGIWSKLGVYGSNTWRIVTAWWRRTKDGIFLMDVWTVDRGADDPDLNCHSPRVLLS
jgi:hypothetical protein